jgi:hypothetical protein
MIYLLIATGLPAGGSSTVHIYTQTIHRTTQNKQYTEQHKNFGRVGAVHRLCGKEKTSHFVLSVSLATERQ